MAFEDKLHSLRKKAVELSDFERYDTAYRISLFRDTGGRWLDEGEKIVKRLSENARYSRAMAEYNIEPAAQIFFQVDKIYNQLGRNGAGFLDRWQTNENGMLLHAVPLGVVGVTGVENAFPANMMYMMFSLALGSPVMFKPAGGDDITVQVMKELIEATDPKSPYAGAIESEYWVGGGKRTSEDIEKEKLFVQSVDAVAVSGHPSAVQHYKELLAGFMDLGEGKYERISVPSDSRLVIFPPKYGASAQDASRETPEGIIKLTRGTVLNMDDWDQYACYGTLYVILKGSDNSSAYLDSLLAQANDVEVEMPRAELPQWMTNDLKSYTQTAIACGFKSIPKSKVPANFRIFYKKANKSAAEFELEDAYGNKSWIPGRHPNLRNLFVFDVPDLEEAIIKDPAINSNMQTMAAYIPDKEERNLFIKHSAKKGISRITPVYREAPSGRIIGGAAYNSLGGPYDGRNRAEEFVNWISDEDEGVVA